MHKNDLIVHSDDTLGQVHDIIGLSDELYDTTGHYNDFNKSDEIVGHSDGKAGHYVHNRTL